MWTCKDLYGIVLGVSRCVKICQDNFMFFSHAVSSCIIQLQGFRSFTVILPGVPCIILCQTALLTCKCASRLSHVHILNIGAQKCSGAAVFSIGFTLWICKCASHHVLGA